MKRKYRFSPRKQNAGCILSTAAAIFLSFSPNAKAASVVIDSDTTSTNGGLSVSTNDTITVTGAGSITITGIYSNDAIDIGTAITAVNDGIISTDVDQSRGIEATDFNTITSTGSISTLNTNSAAIYAEEFNNITNIGVISTSGASSVGIQAQNSNTIVNSGAITTNALASEGMNLLNGNTVTNSGSITTSGVDSDGIEADNLNRITNSGTITTSGTNAAGILAVDSNTIVNSGTISVAGENAYGIEANNFNTIVNSGTINTTGYQTAAIFAEDFNTITNSGTITTSAEDGYGIEVDDHNTVVNSGTIATTGDEGYGIYAGDFNTITNSGTITTAGSDAYGIYVGSNNTVINSGTITTTGVDGVGIYADGDYNNILNSGSITTAGEDAYGIYADDFNIITNTGSITTAGSEAYGIYVNDGNTVVNSGTIVTTGDDADGIYAEDDNIITNTGLISVSGANAVGIYADDNNTITNSGKIIATQGPAIELSSNNTLNLNAPSFIAGAIDVGSDATVNITTGRGNSILWDLQGTMVGGAPNLSGSVPAFYNAATQQVATFDPTGLAAQSDELADLSGAISGLISGRAAHSIAAGPRWWVASFAETTSYDGNSVALDRDASNMGLAIGFEKKVGGILLGALAGFNSSQFDNAQGRFANSWNRESDGYFTALYGRADKGAGFLDFALMGGVSSHDDKRTINDNLAVGGLDSANSSYDSWWFAPQAGLGYAFKMPYDWTMTPYASLRWATQSIDGYSESGSRVNASVADRDVSVLEARAQVSADKQWGITNFGLRAGFQSRTADSDNASITMNEQTQSVSSFADDRNSAFFGGTIGVATSETSVLSLDAEGIAGDGMTSFGGFVKFNMGF